MKTTRTAQYLPSQAPISPACTNDERGYEGNNNSRGTRPQNLMPLRLRKRAQHSREDQRGHQKHADADGGAAVDDCVSGEGSECGVRRGLGGLPARERGGGGDAVEGVDGDDEEDEDEGCDEDVDEEGYAGAGEVADFWVGGFGAEVLGCVSDYLGEGRGKEERGLRLSIVNAMKGVQEGRNPVIGQSQFGVTE